MTREQLENKSKEELIELLLKADQLIIEKEKDINDIAGLIFGLLRALGVKDLEDLDNIGKTLLKAVADIGTSMIMPGGKKRLAAKFAFTEGALPILDKYKHLIPKD